MRILDCRLQTPLWVLNPKSAMGHLSPASGGMEWRVKDEGTIGEFTEQVKVSIFLKRGSFVEYF